MATPRVDFTLQTAIDNGKLAYLGIGEKHDAIAIVERSAGNSSKWMEKVSDEQYLAGFKAE